MKYLQPVLLQDHWVKDHLARLLPLLWDGTTLSDIMTGGYSFWTNPTTSVLVITDVVEHKSGKEFFIYGISGKSILRDRKLVVEDLTLLARVSDCRWIGADALTSGWDWLSRDLGFKPVSTRYLKEMD